MSESRAAPLLPRTRVHGKALPARVLTRARRADTAAVAGTVQRWLTAVAARGRGARAAGVLAGVPRLVAALMQRLSAAVGGMPLDVEISYEADDAVRAPPIPCINPNPAISLPYLPAPRPTRPPPGVLFANAWPPGLRAGAI